MDSKDGTQSESQIRSSELVLRLREQLVALASRAAYVCAHDYREKAPAGTRMIAIEDLKDEYKRTVIVLRETQNDTLCREAGQKDV